MYVIPKIELDLGEKIIEWNSSKYKTQLYKHQGIDLRMTQESEGVMKTYNPYANASHELFANLLNYLKDVHELPNFKLINSINNKFPDKSSNSIGTQHTRALINFYAKEKLPIFEDGKVKLVSIHNGHTSDAKNESYCGYINDKNFIIGVVGNEGLPLIEMNGKHSTNIETRIILDKNDAIITLKGIYFFSPNNESLKKVYESKL